MDINLLKVKHKFLMWCMDDYISLFTLFCFVEEFYKYDDFNLLKATTLNIAKELMNDKFIKAGTLKKENIFEVWKKDINRIINDIKIQWDNLNRSLCFHEIAWFTITGQGMLEFEKLDAIPEVKKIDPFYLDE